MTLSLLISSGLLTTSKAADKSSDDIAAHFPSSQIADILDCISKQAVSVPQFFLKPFYWAINTVFSIFGKKFRDPSVEKHCGPQNCIVDHFRSDLTVKLTLMSIFGHVLDPKIFPADQFMDFGGP